MRAEAAPETGARLDRSLVLLRILDLIPHTLDPRQ